MHSPLFHSHTPLPIPILCLCFPPPPPPAGLNDSSTLLADVVDELWELQARVTGTGASPDVNSAGTPENAHSYMTGVAARFLSSLPADVLPAADMAVAQAQQSLRGAWEALWEALQPTSNEDTRSAVVQAFFLALLMVLVRTDQCGDAAGHLSAVKLLTYLGPSLRKTSSDLNNDLLAALLLRSYEFGYLAVGSGAEQRRRTSGGLPSA